MFAIRAYSNHVFRSAYKHSRPFVASSLNSFPFSSYHKPTWTEEVSRLPKKESPEIHLPSSFLSRGEDGGDRYPDGSPRDPRNRYIPSSNYDNHNHHDDENNDNDDKRKKGSSATGKLAGAAAAGSILMGKSKYLFTGLKIAKAGPLLSMLATSFTYSFFFGWPYSVGMVGLIFVHECGHLVMMRHYNVPFSPMVFVPFMGAVISMKDHPKNAWQDAMIAFGGPVMGSAGAAALAVTGSMTDSQLCFALADFGYMVNLFNLLPIGQMDGGRIGGYERAKRVSERSE